ncbi:acetylcholine receptor subunit alpha-type acr-16-like isoform X2 [Convolutriloba macropyga]|uniref:acetylcholine receptor subunit alpha-type acr-16-like isoform X2 n=1 Tax=Convolutriloba macropyga TaxID=536237 RepID=UPI003F5216E1
MAKFYLQLVILVMIITNLVSTDDVLKYSSACDVDFKRLELGRQIKEKYSTMNQPALRPHEPVVIQYDIALRQLFQVDEKHEVISLLLWERSTWIDPNLRWDPSAFCNITEIRMKETDVWVPDIVISNSVAEFTRPLQTMIPLSVTFNGAVKWNSPSIRYISCPIRVKYFPYDKQYCQLDLVSWTYTSDKLKLETKSVDGFDLSATRDSGEWYVRNTSSQLSIVNYEKNNASHYFLQYKLTIERRPLYYLFYLFVPSSIIMVMSLMTFLLPAESGEKATLAIMVLLSLLILMVSVSEKLPATSKDMPLLSIYFVANMITVCVSMLFSVAIINIHFHPGQLGSTDSTSSTKSGDKSGHKAMKRTLSSRVKHLAFDKLAPYMGIDASPVAGGKDNLTMAFEQSLGTALAIHTKIKLPSRKRFQNLTNPQLADEEKPDTTEILMEKLDIIEKCSLYMASTINSDYKRDAQKLQWVFIAKIVDRLLLIIFSIVFLFTSAMILAYEFYIDYWN